jgi:ABC-type branched-subunit amino acid transport system ATPase component
MSLQECKIKAELVREHNRAAVKFFDLAHQAHRRREMTLESEQSRELEAARAACEVARARLLRHVEEHGC